MMPAADIWRQPDRRFVVTGAARPRDIRDLMGRPFFALGHMARREPLRYRSRQMEIVVEASAPLGMATIRDADILLWLTGQIVDALNHDLWVSRHVRFTPWRLFQDLGWADGTHQYRRLYGALARLAETRVTTSLRQGPEWREKPFAWISDVRISREDGVALTLPDWLTEMACDRSHVLSVDPAYPLRPEPDRHTASAGAGRAGAEPCREIGDAVVMERRGRSRYRHLSPAFQPGVGPVRHDRRRVGPRAGAMVAVAGKTARTGGVGHHAWRWGDRLVVRPETGAGSMTGKGGERKVRF